MLRGDRDSSDELRDRGYTEDQIKYAKSQTKFSSVELFGIRFTRPLVEFKYLYIGFILNLFENYERGCLPFPGSVSEQPGQIIDIFNLLQMIKFEFHKQSNASQTKDVKRR